MRLCPIFFAEVVVALVGAIAPMNAQTITLQSLLAEMTDRDAVARFPEPLYQSLQASS